MSTGTLSLIHQQFQLWIGTHPDGPAKLYASGTKLSSYLATCKYEKDSNREWSGSNILAENEIHLPFIMKIMSIRTTLSLQVHPTKVRGAFAFLNYIL